MTLGMGAVKIFPWQIKMWQNGRGAPAFPAILLIQAETAVRGPKLY